MKINEVESSIRNEKQYIEDLYVSWSITLDHELGQDILTAITNLHPTGYTNLDQRLLDIKEHISKNLFTKLS